MPPNAVKTVKTARGRIQFRVPLAPPGDRGKMHQNVVAEQRATPP
jgi:hypothetical protein